MNNKEDIILEKICNYVDKFEEWIKETHSEEAIKKGFIDEPGFPYWKKVYDCFKELFAYIDLKKLSREDLNNIFYLIDRNNDNCILVNWYGKDYTKISYVGLTESQFWFLCNKVLDTSFDQAKYQLAATISKFKHEPKLARKYLLEFCKVDEEYVKACALGSLAELKFNDLDDLVEEAWDWYTTTEDNRFKYKCLQILYNSNSPKLREYLDKITEKDDIFLQRDKWRCEKKLKRKEENIT